MRIIVRLRGVDVFDLDLRLPIPRPDGPEPPVLQAAAHPVDCSRAVPVEYPDTTIGIGFGRPS